MNPFAPISKVKAVIISNKASKNIIRILEELNIEVIRTKDNINADPRIADHPDVSLHPINEELFVCDPFLYDYYQPILKPYKIDLITGEKSVSKLYPWDCIYNVSRLGPYYIHNFSTDKILSNYLIKYGFEKIVVNQGYSKCSSLILNYDTIVTSDMGLYKALKPYPLNVELFPYGGVSLPGYDTGFLGGSAGMVSEDELILFGDIKKFKFAKELLIILDKYSIKLLCPLEEDVRDLGSLIPVYWF